MALLLEQNRMIIVNINDSSEHLAILENIPGNTKSRTKAKEALRAAQVGITKLLNELENLNKNGK